MYNSIIFGKFIELCIYHQNLILEHFHQSNKDPIYLLKSFSIPTHH